MDKAELEAIKKWFDANRAPTLPEEPQPAEDLAIASLLDYIDQQESRIGTLVAENSALRGRLLVARTHLTFAFDALDLPMVE